MSTKPEKHSGCRYHRSRRSYLFRNEVDNSTRKLAETLPVNNSVSSPPLKPDIQTQGQAYASAKYSTEIPEYIEEAWSYWVTFLHDLTGQWWLPPCPTVARPAQSQTNFSATAITQPTLKPADILAEHFIPAYPKKASARNNRPAIERTTAFDYQNSLYYKAARLTLQEYLNRKPQARTGYTGRVDLTLALILAWTCHPVFGSVEPGKGPAVRWMTLSRQQCARELQMRPQHFIEACEWLEANAIVRTGNPNSGIVNQEAYNQFRSNVQALTADGSYWSVRGLNSASLIYCLTSQELERKDLPPFLPSQLDAGKPIVSAAITEVGKSTEKTQTGKLVAFPRIMSNKQSFPHSFPTQNINSLHDHVYSSNEYLNNNQHEEIHVAESFPSIIALPEANLSESSPPEEAITLSLSEPKQTQAAKLAFLKQEARFEGFTGAAGRITLDYGPALKLANNPLLSLHEAKKVYQQVLEKWRTGELENPIGYFHASLKNQTIVASKPVQRLRATSQSATQFVPSVYSQSQAAKLPEVERAEVAPPLSQPGSTTWERLMEDKSAVIDLWERVKSDDLADRFRVSTEQLKLLVGSVLLITQEALTAQPCASVKLSSWLELSELNHELRNLVRMALTQRLGSGYRLEFEY